MALPPKILVVDDNPSNTRLLGYALNRAGYDVDSANSGPQAIDTAQNTRFDLIFLDIMMPGMDGYEVCKKLKAGSATEGVPVIFLTAKTDEASLLKGFDVGAVDYITKPFKSAELLARTKTHLTLRQTTQALQSARHMQDKLMSVLAHDLRGPVGNFRTALELMLDDYDSQDRMMIRDTVEQLLKSANEVSGLLQNLLEWSGIKSDNINIQPGVFDLNEVIRNSTALFETAAQNKNIKLNFVSQSDIEVFADENMVRTVLRNLLSNAIKFSNPGSEVLIKTRPEPGFAKAFVVDRGVGMDKNQIEKLFVGNSFHTTWGTLNEKGTGIGLKLCKDFLQKNGGDIHVESTKGQGSVFSFSLPLDQP